MIDELFNEVRCNMCDFRGMEHDLFFMKQNEEDEESYIDACPTCQTDEYLMDLK
jgi:hypothetical protein